MRDFNRGEVNQALARMLGVKGELRLDLEQLVVPTLDIADLADSPYYASSFSRGVGRSSTQAAVAAKNGFVGVRPGERVALQVRRVIIGNPEAALAQTFAIEVMSAANISALGALTTAQMGFTSPPEAGQLAPSKLFLAAANTTGAGAVIGGCVLAASSSIILDLPEPGVCLYGDDPGGIPGLVVVGITQNQAVQAAFFGREWPLPG